MAVLETTYHYKSASPFRPGTVREFTETGADNTALVITHLFTRSAEELIWISVTYDNAPTHAGITVVAKSGAGGAAHDFTMSASAANAQTHRASHDEISGVIFGDTDSLVITAPAGGSGQIASIRLITRDIGLSS